MKIAGVIVFVGEENARDIGCVVYGKILVLTTERAVRPVDDEQYRDNRQYGCDDKRSAISFIFH